MKMPIITDDDIENLLQEYNSKTLNHISIDKNSDYWKILKSLNREDFCAVPGSGKTTILALKLAILLKKWPSKYCGICVISHTNVAKEEILDKVSILYPTMRYNMYPHFIGTIQEFIDKFLALSFLRSKISNFELDSVSETQNIAKTKYTIWNGKKELFQKVWPNIDEMWYLKWDKLSHKFCFNENFNKKIENISDLVKSNGEKLDVTKYFNRQKCEQIKRGKLVYNDMFAFANACLYCFPQIKSIIQQRFLMTFLDEAQDTTETQGEILEKIFDGTFIYQRFGDPNQQIFSFECSFSEIFSRKSNLKLDRSYRFSKEIANVLSDFQENKVNIQSTSSDIGMEPRLILFPKGKEITVKDKFIEIMGQNNIGQAYVVGGTGKEKEGDTTITSYIPDYHKPSQSEHIQSIREGALMLKKGQITSKEYISSATFLILKVLKELNPKCKSMNVKQFRDEIVQMGKKYKYHRWLLCFCRLKLQSNRDIDKSKRHYFGCCILKFLFPDIKWCQIQKKLASRGENIFEYKPKHLKNKDGCEKYPFNVSTIHGVKGQTHEATLVLETKFYSDDISYCLNKITQNEKIGELLQQRRRELYVAMSRPKKLLCVACHKENLSLDTLTRLQQENKWEIIEI